MCVNTIIVEGNCNVEKQSEKMRSDIITFKFKFTWLATQYNMQH